MSSDDELFEAIGLKPPYTHSKDILLYYVSLGAFMHVWSFWEYIFDLCIAIIYQRSPHGKTIDKKRPLMLARKIRYFRKAHASIEELKPSAKAAESLTNCFEKMGEFRHTIIHSAQGYTESPLVHEFRRMIPDDGLLLEKHVKLDRLQIMEGAKLISTMLAPTQQYAQLLMDIFPKQES